MKRKNTFYCFSPPVMLATFLVEMALFIYTLLRYKMNLATRLTALLLLFLATFQLAEFMSCGTEDFATWSKVGYLAITALPPLCIHLILTIANKKSPKILFTSYALAAIFGVVFLIPAAFNDFACTGNYVIFHLVNGVSDAYTFYYYGLLFLGIALCIHYAPQAKPPIKRALYWQVFGYGSFLLPTALVNTLQPHTTAGIPSIMCGFAVIYALTLVFAILPLTQAKNKKRPKRA